MCPSDIKGMDDEKIFRLVQHKKMAKGYKNILYRNSYMPPCGVRALCFYAQRRKNAQHGFPANAAAIRGGRLQRDQKRFRFL